MSVRTWQCACGEVAYTMGEPVCGFNPHCFCDDCHSKLSACVEKETGAGVGANKLTEEGAVNCYPCLSKTMNCIKGAEHVRYFRTGRKNRGTEDNGKNAKAVSAYAGCCGTYAWTYALEFGPGVVSFCGGGNGERMTGGKKTSKWYTFGQCTEWTGIVPPKGAPKMMSMGMMLRAMPFMMCGCCYNKGWPSDNPEFQPCEAYPNAHHNGKMIDYVPFPPIRADLRAQRGVELSPTSSLVRSRQ